MTGMIGQRQKDLGDGILALLLLIRDIRMLDILNNVRYILYVFSSVQDMR